MIYKQLQSLLGRCFYPHFTDTIWKTEAKGLPQLLSQGHEVLVGPLTMGPGQHQALQGNRSTGK